MLRYKLLVAFLVRLVDKSQSYTVRVSDVHQWPTQYRNYSKTNTLVD